MNETKNVNETFSHPCLVYLLLGVSAGVSQLPGCALIPRMWTTLCQTLAMV